MGANGTRYSLEGNSPRLLLPITLCNVILHLIDELGDGPDHRRPHLLSAVKAVEAAFRLKPRFSETDLFHHLEALDATD